jgi:hypothetical protein
MSTKKPTPLEAKLAKVRATRGGATSPTPRDAAAASPRHAEPGPALQSPRAAGGYRRRSSEPPYADRVPRATFYIDRTILDELDAVCRERDFNKSEFVREAIVRHIAHTR